MNIVVIGVGYVGLVTGLSLVKLGNKITFLDTDGNAISSVFSNGSSNSSIQFNVPAGFDVTIMGLNTTNYQIFGNATSTTAPAFADQ